MNFHKGTKLWSVGECDTVFAPTKEEAYQVMVDMCGKEHTDEVIEHDPIEEYTQEQFDNGEIYWDQDGDMDRAIRNKSLMSMKDALDDYLKDSDGVLSGHFSSTEW